MSSSSLAAALASGASVVTPNNRLAREVITRFDAAQLARGARAWTPAQAMPWTSWLETLWRAAVGSGSNLPALLDPAASREAWYRLVAQHPQGLVNARGAARHALEAWGVFHAWRAPDESPGQIAARGDEDAQSFARWADAYQAQLDAMGAIDRAQLPDRLAACAGAWTVPLGNVVLYGFVAFTPQQQRLLGALRAAGVAIEELPVASEPAPQRYRTLCATPSLELTEAFAFARSAVVANPADTVAIVVADLARRRDEVVAIADEALCPDRLLSLARDASRPYDVSLGQPLGSVPVVASALDLIALTGGTVDATLAASAIRAPFLPDAPLRWQQRAAIEGRWRAEGRRTVGWNDVLVALARYDGALHARFAAMAHRSRSAQSPREWARTWSETLAALGWPGTATLSSAQWQAREAWSASLAKFASVGVVTGPLTAVEALESLRALLADTLWAAEAAPAQIRVLGIFEAAGLAFDHAWLAGFDAQRWPPAAAANPFLPIAWQRARGVVDAHPDASLARARAVTMQLSSLAPHVVVSHAERIDDAPVTLSPLFADWPSREPSTAATFVRWSAAMPAVTLERAIDARGPPLAADVALRGGAGLFESQSTCPFQAFARHRLRTEAWAEVPEGLSPRERGTVLHAVMKAFWDGVGDQATLVALGARELAERIAAAVDAGKSRLDAARWRTIPPAVAAAEARRLAALLTSWIDEVERVRSPFRVRSHEQPIEFAIEGLPMRLRIDRIDELDAGGIAIVDYKSGAVTRPVRWLAARPAGVQLGVYAHGLDVLDSGDIRVLAYAQLKAGEIGTTGLMATEGLFPGLEVPGAGRSRVHAASFGDARAQLDASLRLLARELRDGVALVAPRDRSDCAYCEQKPLCRIRRLDDTVVVSLGARDE